MINLLRSLLLFGAIMSFCQSTIAMESESQNKALVARKAMASILGEAFSPLITRVGPESAIHILHRSEKHHEIICNFMAFKAAMQKTNLQPETWLGEQFTSIKNHLYPLLKLNPQFTTAETELELFSFFYLYINMLQNNKEDVSYFKQHCQTIFDQQLTTLRFSKEHIKKLTADAIPADIVTADAVMADAGEAGISSPINSPSPVNSPIKPSKTRAKTKTF